VFLVNSRLGLDSAASSRSGSKSHHPNEAPLLPKLRGYFAEFLSQSSPDRLGILYLPTCVGFGTGTHCSSLEVFLGGRESAARQQKPADITSQVRGLRIFLEATLHACPWSTNATVRLSFRVTPSLKRSWWHWNMNQLSIAYACRPRLRSRLTLS
jgi:hypothetical protein